MDFFIEYISYEVQFQNKLCKKLQYNRLHDLHTQKLHVLYKTYHT